MAYLARCTPLLLLLLGSCRAPSWGGVADWITPDELTLGQGSSTSALNGHLDDSYGWHDFDFDSTGESESTYAALTWDIPEWEGKEGSGMSRETQRNMALLLDKIVEDEKLSITDGGSASAAIPALSRLRDGKGLPPLWVVIVLGAVIASLIFAAIKKKRGRRSWR